MLISEGEGDWRPVSRWIEYLIHLGYVWPRDISEHRRIALISMPCDSAAAGLVSLGALIRDLERPEANDVDGHYDALLRFARQYLESCRDCAMRCQPERRGCDYVQEAKGRLLSLQPRRRYTVSDDTNFAERKLAFVTGDAPRRASTVRHGPVTEILSPQYVSMSTNFYIEGGPPPQIGLSALALAGDAYAMVIEGARLVPENLARSYSGLCLSGRTTGEAVTRHVCSSIRFRFEHGEFSLLDLLTLRDTRPSNAASRLTFFNARTDHFDRLPSPPALVVADGGSSFIKVLGQPYFQLSNVLGIYHRTTERDDLEIIGNRITSLRQWYVEDVEMLDSLPSAPRGVSILILRKLPA